MRQETFELKNDKLWEEYNLILQYLNDKKSNPVLNVNTGKLPAMYRKVCNHYAVALTRQYSPALVTKLHNMVLSGHKKIYRQKSFRLSVIANFFSYTFPATFRNNFIYFVIALLLFIVPFAGTGVSCFMKHDLLYSIMGEGQVSKLEYMYDPANRRTGRVHENESDSSVMMFGFYIQHNISIGFRTFAGGILAGIGSVFFLIYNGVVIGGIAGHVTRLGFTETFWPFVSGHGAFELTAIIISGMAGLVIAKAIIAPGNYKRSDALKLNAKVALNLMLGAATMLLIAAFIEAFWSPSGVANIFKYTVAGILWVLVFIYFYEAGKKYGPAMNSSTKAC